MTQPNATPMLDHALALLQLAPVFPLAEGSKIPLPASRGHLDATRDESQVRAWWTRHPRANVGVALGHPSPLVPEGRVLVCLDVDTQADGDATLREREGKHGALPGGPRALSPSGGFHCYLHAPAGTARIILGPGLDLRALGQYMAAPPSWAPPAKSPPGTPLRPYLWEAEAGLEDCPIPPAPAWMFEALEAPAAEPAGSNVAGDAMWSYLGAAFAAAGMLGGKRLKDGARPVLCPWRHEHTTGKDYDTSTVLFAPRGASTYGHFHCSHGHCHGRGAVEALAALDPQAVSAARLQYPGPERRSSSPWVPDPPEAPGAPEEAPRAPLVEGGAPVRPLDLWDASAMEGEPPQPDWIVPRLHLASSSRAALLTAYSGAGQNLPVHRSRGRHRRGAAHRLGRRAREEARSRRPPRPRNGPPAPLAALQAHRPRARL